MAEGDVGNVVAQYLDWSVFNDIYGMLVILLLLTVVAIGLFFFFYFGSFKYKVRLREVKHGRVIIIDSKAREIKDKEGISWWQILYKRKMATVPPSSAIELDARGKNCVEAYLPPSGEIIWAIDQVKVKDIPNSILEIKDEKQRKEAIKVFRTEHKLDEGIEIFQPLSSTDKSIIANQVRKAQERRTKDWKDYIMPLASLGALVIIVVSLMIFYEDMGKPLLEMADKQVAYQSQITQQMDLMRQMSNDIQVLKSQGGIVDASAPN